MLINERCTVCHSDVEADDVVICDRCENAIHEQCEDYETTFECPTCASEVEIDAVEF